MSNASIGYNSAFGIDNGTTYDDVAEVVSIQPPGMNREAIEVTHLKSPDKYKEYIAGLADGGEATIGINFLPTETDALVTAFEAETGGFQITFPNGVRFQFAGIVTSYEISEVVVDDKMSATFGIKATGKPTLLAAV